MEGDGRAEECTTHEVPTREWIHRTATSAEGVRGGDTGGGPINRYEGEGEEICEEAMGLSFYLKDWHLQQIVEYRGAESLDGVEGIQNPVAVPQGKTEFDESDHRTRRRRGTSAKVIPCQKYSAETY